MARAASHVMTFTKAALLRQHTVGAIAPSSPRLAHRLAGVLDARAAPVVAELGPGTGSVTAAIAARLQGRGTQLALEVDPTMLQYLRRAHPRVDVHEADAAQLRSVLDGVGIEALDAVVSGLPWTLFAAEKQRGILDAVVRSLKPDGVFTTFSYSASLVMPSAKRFRGLLDTVFGDVAPTRTILANLPPAMTYVCRGPAPA